MSEVVDGSQATPYGIAVAGLLKIEDICEEIHDCDVSDIRSAAVEAREEASRVSADHRAAALLPQPDDKPKPATVIIVTEAGGREVLYCADGWTLTEGTLFVNNHGHAVAFYQQHAWLSVREEDATAPDYRALLDKATAAHWNVGLHGEQKIANAHRREAGLEEL